MNKILVNRKHLTNGLFEQRFLSLKKSLTTAISLMDKAILRSLDELKKEFRKQDRSLRNRIKSILFDNAFLESRVIPTFPRFPIVPNERCGVWYCDPAKYLQTSYFKSTDGHINQWDFSTRRLNFHLLPLLEAHSGVIIVDSTRRGKKIPDALSKTVPIWCAVLNGIMLKATNQDILYDQLLYIPPQTVSDSERSRIIKKLPELIEKLETLNIFDGAAVYESFGRRLLRPFWVYPGADLFESSRDVFTGEVTTREWDIPKESGIIPIILCTVSYQAQDGVDRRNGFIYHQGAADDHELWSNGLEPEIFWKNIVVFRTFSGSDEDMECLVSDIVAQENQTRESQRSPTDFLQVFKQVDEITKGLQLGVIKDGLTINGHLIKELEEKFSLVIILSETVTLGQTSDKEKCTCSIQIYPLQSGAKKSSKELRAKLIDIDQNVKRVIYTSTKPILVCCNNGKDISVGVLLMILSKYYSQEWELLPEGEIAPASKITIRKHLTSIISHLPERSVNPSRATLNSVNSFLM